MNIEKLLLEFEQKLIFTTLQSQFHSKLQECCEEFQQKLLKRNFLIPMS